MDRNALSIIEVTDAILEQMETSGFKESTRGFYVTLFRRLCRMAEERGEKHYTTDLGIAFINDDSHIIPENTERYHHERTVAYNRCIKFVESFLATGQVDWTPALHAASFPINSDFLRESFSAFLFGFLFFSAGGAAADSCVILLMKILFFGVCELGIDDL
jgi:hypothetical protein